MLTIRATYGSVTLTVDSDIDGTEVLIVGDPDYAEADWNRALDAMSTLDLGTCIWYNETDTIFHGWYSSAVDLRRSDAADRIVT